MGGGGWMLGRLGWNSIAFVRVVGPCRIFVAFCIISDSFVGFVGGHEAPLTSMEIYESLKCCEN